MVKSQGKDGIFQTLTGQAGELDPNYAAHEALRKQLPLNGQKDAQSEATKDYT